MRVRTFFTIASLLASLGCSAKTQLGTQGTSCDTDEQCGAPLVCKCVVRRNPDEEGPDEILVHGKCQVVTFKCTNLDGGTGDSARDTALPDVPADVPTDSGTADVTDAIEEAAADGG